jgi:ubiquinol-cytochrome c reductase cytochrome c subunit
MKRRLAALFLVAATFHALGAGAADPVRGKRLFMSVGCYACHGTVGQGASPTGPRLAPNPPALADFLKELRTPRNVMPPYAVSVLPDAAVADIRAYLAGIAPPAQRP